MPRLPLPRPRANIPFLSTPTTPRFYATSTILPTPAEKPAYPATQPPAHRAATARKTQLHRQYLSLLRSTPLLLIFQHNNLRATEWSAIRREITTRLSKVSPDETTGIDSMAEGIKINVLRGAIFDAAIRVADYYDPTMPKEHGTSKEAYALTAKKSKHSLAPIITGPIGAVSFPKVSPEHLKVVLDVMFPDGRAIKGMDPLALTGIQKLYLLAARVDGHAAGQIGKAETLDREKVKWVSTLPGEDGIRGELVAILQSVGGGALVQSLQSIGVNVVRTVDAHRKVLSGELEPKGEEAAAAVEETKV